MKLLFEKAVSEIKNGIAEAAAGGQETPKPGRQPGRQESLGRNEIAEQPGRQESLGRNEIAE